MSGGKFGSDKFDINDKFKREGVMSSIDVKSTDGRVFGLWARAECEECDNEFLVTRAVEKTVFGKLVCSDCIDYAKSFEAGEKSGIEKVGAIHDRVSLLNKKAQKHGDLTFESLLNFIDSLDDVKS